MSELDQMIVDWQDRWLVRVNKLGHAQEALADITSRIAHLTAEAEARARHKAYNQIMKATDRQFPAPVNGSPMELSRDGEVFNAVTKNWENAVKATLNPTDTQSRGKA